MTEMSDQVVANMYQPARIAARRRLFGVSVHGVPAMFHGVLPIAVHTDNSQKSASVRNAMNYCTQNVRYPIATSQVQIVANILCRRRVKRVELNSAIDILHVGKFMVQIRSGLDDAQTINQFELSPTRDLPGKLSRVPRIDT